MIGFYARRGSTSSSADCTCQSIQAKFILTLCCADCMRGSPRTQNLLCEICSVCFAVENGLSSTKNSLLILGEDAHLGTRQSSPINIPLGRFYLLRMSGSPEKQVSMYVSLFQLSPQKCLCVTLEVYLTCCSAWRGRRRYRWRSPEALYHFLHGLGREYFQILGVFLCSSESCRCF